MIELTNIENLSSSAIDEIIWELNKDFYIERPVTIQEFIHSDRFLGKTWPNVFPLWKETLYKIYPSPFSSPYTEVIISAATGAGKTTCSTIGILYDMYRLGCLKDPSEYYGLAPNTKCIFGVFSTNLALAGSVNWSDLVKGIEGCPWLNEKVIDRRGLEKKNGSLTFVEILPNIGIQTGSRFQHSMGKAIFGALMDEAAFGLDKTGQAQKTYTEIFSRMATRFISYSNKGELPGHMWLASSPKDATDFLQTRIDIANQAEIKTTLVLDNISSWQANPANNSKEKFAVFIGNDFKEAKILEPNEKPSIEDMDYMLYPPIRFYDFFKKDLLSSIMNYGGIRTISDIGIFKSPSLIQDAMVIQNPFVDDVVKLPFADDDKQLLDLADLSYFKDIRHPEANRFIHLDIAYSSNTIDRFGIAACYAIPIDKTVYKDLSDPTKASYILERAERIYYVDFAIGIEPIPNQEVPIKKVEDFIIYLIKVLNYPVACISADTFQSKRTLQEFERLDFVTSSVSVDRSRDPYLFFKDCVSSRNIILPNSKPLKKEMLCLRDNGKKIDHPPLQTKDIADGVAGSLWNCHISNNIINIAKLSQAILNANMPNAQYCTEAEKVMMEQTQFQNAVEQLRGRGVFRGL